MSGKNFNSLLREEVICLKWSAKSDIRLSSLGKMSGNLKSIIGRMLISWMVGGKEG